MLKELIVTFQQSFSVRLKEREVEIPVGSDKIVVLKGVRRSGKSSALHLTINKVISKDVTVQQILFLNFDDERIPFEPSEFDLILQSYRELYPQIKMSEVYFFFDEIQVSNGWEQFVRRVYDNESKHVFLTGSNSKLLSSEIASSLRGRTLQYEFFPLSFGEYCHFRDIKANPYNAVGKALLIQSFQKFLTLGGFPELVLSDFAFHDRILQEYYHVMLYRDLVERYEIKNLSALKYFIRRILINVTKPTSINKIYNELKSVGINVGKNSLYEWIDHLEAVYMFLALPKYEPSMVRENASEKKYYCIDNGLQTALSTNTGKNLGAMLENAVFLWIRRNLNPGSGIYYYKGNKECDFVLTEGSGVVCLIQASWDLSEETTYKREIEGLLEASSKLHCDNLLLITAERDDDVEYHGKKIRIRPAYSVCKEPFSGK